MTAKTTPSTTPPTTSGGTTTGDASTSTTPLKSALKGADATTGAAMLTPPPPTGPTGEAKNKIDAEAMEHADGGHSLARHGPEISDKALEDRLTTGMAPDGKLSPAPGLSTKFASYDEYLKTRTTAASTLSAAIGSATSTLQGPVDAVKKAQDDFTKEPSGPGKGQKSKDLATAKTNLKSAVSGIGQTNTTVAPMKFVASGKTVEDMVTLYGGYQVIKDHGRPVGSGFEGEDAKKVANPVDASKDDIQVYDKTKAISGGVSQTQTSYDTPGGGGKLFGVAHTPSSWKAGQHFPTKGTDGISV